MLLGFTEGDWSRLYIRIIRERALAMYDERALRKGCFSVTGRMWEVEVLCIDVRNELCGIVFIYMKIFVCSCALFCW